LDVAYSWDKLQQGGTYDPVAENLTESGPTCGAAGTSSRPALADGSSITAANVLMRHVVHPWLVVGVIALVGVVVARRRRRGGRCWRERVAPARDAAAGQAWGTSTAVPARPGARDGARERAGVLPVSPPAVRVRYLIPNFLA
jgi:hypothetical protein